MSDDFNPSMFGPEPMVPGLPFSDALPTHPEQRSTKQNMTDTHDMRVHVKEFTLARDKQREELEEVLTKIVLGTCIELKQRWANDPEGLTTVALSWVELIPKRAPRKPGTTSGDSWAAHGVNPGIPDGEHPGTGGDLPTAKPADAGSVEPDDD